MPIQRLSQDTINKIAAGEVVQRPSNAIKELIENSIDAESTSITVTLVEGGLKELTVTDNGKGIAKEDFPLVCQRFATSKIRSYEDLLTIGSFGFRGEALASLSYVSEVTVVSKQRQADLAYSANFSEGKMTSTPQPHHLSVGTVITARNMFGTCLRVRKESLKAGEERRRILKVVSQFAVHYSSVKFRVVSDGRVELTTEHCASSNLNNKLVVFSQLFQHRPDDIFQADTKLNSTACLTGIFTKPKTASAKSKSLMLLVNNRIVELTDIFTAVDDAYISCYKSIHLEDITYTVYLSLSIDPKLIDCNVHPTKKVVQIVNSADLCEKITKWVLEVLKAECRIMPFYEQEKMPIRVLIDQSKKGKDAPRESNQLSARTRTDSKQLPLRYYIPQQSVQQETVQADSKVEPQICEEKRPFIKKEFECFPATIEDRQQNAPRIPTAERIDLRCSVASPSAQVKEFIRNVTYVGCVNSNFLLIQHEQTLRLLNILPFMPALLIAWLRKQPILSICQLKVPTSLAGFLTAFTNKSKLLFDNSKFEQILITNRKAVGKHLKIYISQQGTVTHVCYPLKIMDGRLRDCELGYLLARTAKHLLSLQDIEDANQSLLHSYLIDYLSSLFEEPFTDYVPSSARQYDSWYRDKIIPLAKLKGEFPATELGSCTLQMLHLKQVYKVFERC